MRLEGVNLGAANETEDWVALQVFGKFLFFNFHPQFFILLLINGFIYYADFINASRGVPLNVLLSFFNILKSLFVVVFNQIFFILIT